MAEGSWEPEDPALRSVCQNAMQEVRRLEGVADPLSPAWLEVSVREQPPLAHSASFKATWSPDGTRVLTCTNSGAQLWDAFTGQPVTPPLVHAADLTCAAFSPNGEFVLTASSGGKSALVWDARTGQPVCPPLRHDAAVNHAAFSPDGTRVITASDDTTARVWEVRTGQLVCPPLRHDNSHDSRVTIAAFDAAGSRVLTAGKHNTWARVWDVATGQVVFPPLRAGYGAKQFAFSRDGSLVLLVDGAVQVWDAATGQAVTPVLVHSAWHAEFSPDGTRVLTVNGLAEVWDVRTGQPAFANPLRHEGTVSRAQFSPDGTRVVTASKDETARVWDARTGQPITPPLEHFGEVAYALFSPDGTRVLSVEAIEKRAGIWDAWTGQPLLPLVKHKQLKHAEFSPDGTRVLLEGWDRTVRFWDVPSRNAIDLWPDEATPADLAAIALALPRAATPHAAASLGLAQVVLACRLNVPLEPRVLQQTPPTASTESAAEDSPPGLDCTSSYFGKLLPIADLGAWTQRRLASGGSESLWNLLRDLTPTQAAAVVESARAAGWSPVEADRAHFETLVACAARWTPRGPLLAAQNRLQFFAEHIAVSPRGDLAVVLHEHMIRVLRLPTRAVLATARSPIKLSWGGTSDVTRVAVSEDGQYFAAADGYENIVVLRLPQLELLYTLKSDNLGSVPITALALSQAADVVLAGTNHGNVLAWRLSDGKPVARQEHDSSIVDALTPFANGRYCLSETEHGRVRVWSLPNLEVVADLGSNDLQQARAADSGALIGAICGPDQRRVAYPLFWTAPAFKRSLDGFDRCWDLPFSPAMDFAINPAGDQIITCGHGAHALYLWSLPGYERLATYDWPPGDWVGLQTSSQVFVDWGTGTALLTSSFDPDANVFWSLAHPHGVPCASGGTWETGDVDPGLRLRPTFAVDRQTGTIVLGETSSGSDWRNPSARCAAFAVTNLERPLGWLVAEKLEESTQGMSPAGIEFVRYALRLATSA